MVAYHIEGYRRAGAEIVAIADLNEEAAKKVADVYKIPNVFGKVEDMFEKAPEVEAVSIIVPNKFHAPLSIQALKAGKHVFCEKPLAVTSEESAELVELAAASDRITAVNYNIRFYPLNQHAHQMIRDGELGEPRLIHGHYVQDWLLLDTDWNWRLEPSKGGELRAFGDIGTHWVDLTSFISGLTVESVLADLSTFVKVRQQPKGPVETFSQERAAETSPMDMSTDDAALILLRYANGARGSVVVSQVSAGRKNSLQWEIDGSKAAAWWDSEHPDHLTIGHRNRPNEVMLRSAEVMNDTGTAAASLPGGHVEGFGDTFRALFREIYRAVDAGRAPERPLYATFADGHHEMVVGDAVIRSAREGRWVDVAR